MAGLRNLNRNYNRLSDLESFIQAIPREEHSVHSLGVHRQELTRLWEVFRDSYEDLLENAEDTKVSTKDAKAKYMSGYTLYFQSASFIDGLIDSLKDKAANPIANTVPIHLPPCDTPTFSGDYASWPTFRDMFSAIYGTNPHISNIQKMYYLLQKTEGEARDIIRTCPMTNDGFDMAWQNLVDRYENKRLLVNFQLKTLFNLPAISKESGPSIKSLQRTINDCISNLSLLGIETRNWDIIFVYICSTKLPEHTLGLWEQSQGPSSDLPKWSKMDAFLTARYRTLESVSDIIGSHNFTQSEFRNDSQGISHSPRKLGTYKTVDPNIPQRKCPICSQNHPIRLCPNFLRMTVTDRLSTVKRHMCCTNCLAVSHEFKRCQSSNVCYICKQKHHSLLHRSESSTREGPRAETNPVKPFSPDRSLEIPRPPEQKRNEVDNCPSTSATTRSFYNYATRLQSTPSSTVLLGTAQVNIELNNAMFSTRALIDPASQATFISRKLQRKLDLPTYSAPAATVVGLNGAVVANSAKVCTISLGSPIDPSFKLTTEAYVVEKLSGQLPTCSLAKYADFDAPELPSTELKYAHMDLLLGGDVYPQIMLSGVRKDPRNTLIAQQTVFGWVVTGKIRQSNWFPFKSKFPTDLSLGPSRKGAFAQNMRSDYYKAPRLKPNEKRLLVP